MKFKIILLFFIFFSSINLNGCGRKDAPIKPTKITIMN